ncbi:MerR family transcriptional regulator [Lactimicrobium sp.]|jgi:DNA-binding transcriptional MerR regulator|uniref:MerR family transcriptional regulator n=2 Tax=Lactimicrobium sp. TaxID=2563780 RepID=UPI002F353317
MAFNKYFTSEEKMYIHELSKLTNTNPETIRMYRKKGLLHPNRLANGYYDYSMADFASLMHLRKLRDFSMSFHEIEQALCADSSQFLLDSFSAREKAINDEIAALQEKIRYLELEKRHIRETMDEGFDSVRIMQSVDTKIDFYPPFEEVASTLLSLHYQTTTICLHISKEILNGPIVDKEIPLQAGIGTYRYMLKDKTDIPEKAVVIPNGLCISQLISLQDLTRINILSLAPMMTCAKSNHTPFLSDTTAYLATMNYQQDKPVYIFRLRACIEKNDICDPDTRIQN